MISLQTAVLILVLQATFGIAVFWATTRADLRQLRKDHEDDLEALREEFREEKAAALTQRNNIGKIVEHNDGKANRRYQQMAAALLESHADEPPAVKRFSKLLNDDSWE